MALSIAALTSTSDSADLYQRIEASYFNPSTGYYKEEIGKNDVAFNWTLGIILSAQNAMAHLDKSYVPKLKQTLEKADTYWNTMGPVAGFDVLPGPHNGKDRYYDDNEWMVMSLVESYEITHDTRWLKRAEQALDFSLSGEDEKLGGGIYWREREKKSKNTCSNGPAAAACIAVYRVNHRRDLLTKAGAIYQWTKANLRDHSDGLYYDSKSLNGRLGKDKWTYNSALMLRAARGLWEETKLDEYRQDMVALQDACIKKWVKEDGSVNDEMQFAHLLFENLDPSAFDATKCVAKLKSLAQPNGFFPQRWTGSEAKAHPKLMIQVSALRALAVYDLWVRDGRVKR